MGGGGFWFVFGLFVGLFLKIDSTPPGLNKYHMVASLLSYFSKNVNCNVGSSSLNIILKT